MAEEFSGVGRPTELVKAILDAAAPLIAAQVDQGRIEPNIWSHLTDELPSDHPLAREQVYCRRCRALVHAFNNECMQTWVETGKGPYCLACFAAEGGEVLEERDGWALVNGRERSLEERDQAARDRGRWCTFCGTGPCNGFLGNPCEHPQPDGAP